MSLWPFLVVLLLLLLALSARWLFRQRRPDEIRAAREKLRSLRDKPK